jgi:hypothetical protein
VVAEKGGGADIVRDLGAGVEADEDVSSGQPVADRAEVMSLIGAKHLDHWIGVREGQPIPREVERRGPLAIQRNRPFRAGTPPGLRAFPHVVTRGGTLVSAADPGQPQAERGIGAVTKAHEKGRAPNRTVTIGDHGDVAERSGLLRQLVIGEHHPGRHGKMGILDRLTLAAKRFQRFGRQPRTDVGRFLVREK